MPIKIYKRNRAARKNASIVDRTSLYRGKPNKRLRVSFRRTSGRGSSGRITVRHRGGGAKRLTRIINFGQEKLQVPATVQRIEYDPGRSSNIALMKYEDGSFGYVLAWHGISEGDQVTTDEKTPERPGNRMQLQHMTPGIEVFNVELTPGRGGKLFRSAGTYGVLMDVQESYAQLKMSSGEIRLIQKESYGTVGKVSNADWRLVRIGSAGKMRRLGRRPQVRGKAMNPVDHPHGGGEGQQPIGLKHPKTKWGKPALGVKTRRAGKYSDHLILERRKKKKRT